MFYLLDTGRMAYQFGKWRGALHLAATAVPLALANLIAKIFGIFPGQPKPQDAVQWAEIGFYVLALFFGAYGSYRLYRDHVHHDYYLEADHYRREGW